jgi:hypothetical protein
MWLAGGVLVVSGAVVAWSFWQDESPRTVVPTPTEQPRAEAPVDNPDTSGNNVVAGTPKITFPEREYDFGTIAQGTKPSHRFVVKNTGDAPLRLISAKGT